VLACGSALGLLAGSAGWGQDTAEPPQEATTPAPEPAEPAEPVKVASVEEIVVTARKVAENLQEVPLAITAFDANMIEEKRITNLSDVANLTPGLSFFNAFGENLPVPVIRGIAPTDIFGQNNAAIFVDGVYISGREGLNAVQLDMERIEVVKGPQSALYGRNAFSGAVNYVTKLPIDEFEAEVTAEVGNDGLVRGSGVINVPIFGEKLSSRFAALYDDWDGSYDNSLAPENDLGGHRYRGFKAALRSQLGDAWDINLTYYKANDDIDESPSVSFPTNCEDRVNDNNAATRLQNFCGEVPDIEAAPGLNGGSAIPKVAQATGENRELDRGSLRIEWDLMEWGTISALTGYSKTFQSSVSDFTRSLGLNQQWLYCNNAVNTPGIPNTCTNPPDQELLRFTSGVFDREMGGETEEWSQELRYTSSQDQRFRYTAGGYWYQVDRQAFPGAPIATRGLPDGGAVALPPFSDPPDPQNLAIGSAIFFESFQPDGGIDPLGRPTTDDTTDGWAVFGGIDFDITERLIGRAELRYSEEDQELNLLRYARCYTSATTSGVLGNCAYPQELIALTGHYKYDLRQIAPVPQFGPECTFLSIEGVVLPGTAGQCGRHGEASFDSTTGRVGLDFKINDEWMVYGSVAYGEKPGGLQLASGNEVVGDSVTPVVITSTFDPEELTAYELGLKGTTWDNRLQFSTAVFYNDWKKIVLRQLVEKNPETGGQLEQPVALNVNAGDAGVLGFEFEANAALTEGLKARFTLGWADAELDNAAQDTYEQFPTFAPDGDVSGNKLLRQPEWLVSGSLDYEHALRGDWEWYVGGDANYQSGVYVGNENQAYLPEHTYVNTRLGVRSGATRIEFWTRNLFNDTSAIAAFRDIYWANTDDQYPDANGNFQPQGGRPGFDDFVPLRFTVTYPNERTYGLSVTQRFGAAIR
jgi:outer membrane receptor protein involved in Fe transport